MADILTCYLTPGKPLRRMDRVDDLLRGHVTNISVYAYKNRREMRFSATDMLDWAAVSIDGDWAAINRSGESN